MGCTCLLFCLSAVTTPKENFAKRFRETVNTTSLFSVSSKEWGFASCRNGSMPWDLTMVHSAGAHLLKPLLGVIGSCWGNSLWRGWAAWDFLSWGSTGAAGSRLCCSVSSVVFLLGTWIWPISVWEGKARPVPRDHSSSFYTLQQQPHVAFVKKGVSWMFKNQHI